MTEDIRTARMTDMHVKQANDLDDILGERGQTIPTTLSTYKYARGFSSTLLQLKVGASYSRGIPSRPIYQPIMIDNEGK